MKCKHWCWTLNNFSNDEFQQLVALAGELPDPVVYVIFGKELGAQGTPHLQGFISFSRRVTFNATKRLISPRCHLEKAKGSPSQAAEYCRKEGDYTENGVLPIGQGARTDLEEIGRAVTEGTSVREIADRYPTTFIKYASGITKLAMFYRPQREHPPHIWVFWGETGTGKTKRVWEFADVDQMWIHPGERWFDGYNQQPSVLLDDFDGSWFKLGYLLKLLDRYPFPVPVKGGYVWWVPQTIYITTNIEPKEWYCGANQSQRNALLRRLREYGDVQHCTHD